jgi:hypothetical protein
MIDDLLAEIFKLSSEALDRSEAILAETSEILKNIGGGE